MKQRKEQGRIKMTLPSYMEVQTTEVLNLWDIIGYGQNIASPYVQKKEKDKLSFMGTFTFPKISEFKKSLLKSKKYTKKQVSEIIKGLEDLPEYAK